jgi:hypothetical protein
MHAQTAYRFYILREALRGRAVFPDDDGGLAEMTPEEEAGAVLEAELANDLSLLRAYYEAVHKQS